MSTRLSLPGRAVRALSGSLSARLLVLTIFFVMLAEVFIFAPSIANYRMGWLEQRLSTAHLAALSGQGAGTDALGKPLTYQVLDHVRVLSILVEDPARPPFILAIGEVPPADLRIDLRGARPLGLMADAFTALVQTRNRVLEVRGTSPEDASVLVTLVLDEDPLRADMRDFAVRIFWLSIIISIFTAILVYLSLQWLMVAPMRRITASMVAFRENPTRQDTDPPSSRRRDEIGIAQRELATMQAGLRAALRQKAHLAALGEAVAKINHDLRNMLATARLVSDRLAASDDPEVRRASPMLERALDKAVNLCTQTLSYATDAAAMQPTRFGLVEMLEEVPSMVAPLAADSASLRIEVSRAFELTADREQMLRVFVNLVRNAAEAGARQITIRLAGRSPARILVSDDGPGLPEQAVQSLFQPFRGSGRRGGTGLGLAIARELVEAHGGSIALDRTGPDGTCFSLTLPEHGLGPARPSPSFREKPDA